jgi:hypothetical protein
MQLGGRARQGRDECMRRKDDQHLENTNVAVDLHPAVATGSDIRAGHAVAARAQEKEGRPIEHTRGMQTD